MAGDASGPLFGKGTAGPLGLTAEAKAADGLAHVEMDTCGRNGLYAKQMVSLLALFYLRVVAAWCSLGRDGLRTALAW